MDTAADFRGAHRTRLFVGICLALIPTGAAFALISNVLGQLKEEFILTNYQAGLIGGAALWGMAISLLVFGPMLEGYGMKKGAVLAFVGHLLGLTLLISAVALRHEPGAAFALLMVGAILLAGGNGMVEVVGNPLTAALYPADKTTKLNLFHAFFPMAILIAGLVGYTLNQLSHVAGGFFHHWTFQVGIVYVPMIIYGIMLLPQTFPPTENTAAGIPVKEMFRYTLTHPLMYALLVMMGIAISLELGSNRWIPEIFARLGVPGILLLSWIAFVMMILRLFASHFVERFSPPGMLCGAAFFTGTGLVLFSMAQGTTSAFFAATFFGVGVSFFFPTIVGIVSERLPRTGSLGIVLTCGVGLGAAGAIGVPGIGLIGDHQLARYLDADERRGDAVALLTRADRTLPDYIARAEQASVEELRRLGYRASDVERAVAATRDALADHNASGRIVGEAVPNALRGIVGSGIPAEQEPLIAGAAAVINPAEGYGGQQALRFVAPFTLILIVFFGAMYIRDRRRGGYRVERLEVAAAAQSTGQIAE
ncbi:MAG: MFS transporter [Luteitalea sp.]|nr:MFS transporter [Luteitalea sp.]